MEDGFRVSEIHPLKTQKEFYPAGCRVGLNQKGGFSGAPY